MQIDAIIQARLTSTRLPGKVLMKIGEKRVLDWVNNACDSVGFDNIIIAIPDSPENNPMRKEFSHVRVEDGSENDVMDRYIKTAEKAGSEYIVRVCSDNPFLQTEYLKEIFNKCSENKYDYISYYNDNRNCITSPYGLFAEGIKVEALNKAYRFADNELKEHVTKVLYDTSLKESMKIYKLELPESLKKYEYIRFTLDNAFDYELYRKMAEKYPQEYYSTKDLLRILDSDEEIREEMKINYERGGKK